MEFLGHIISVESREVDQKNIEADKNHPRPLTWTDIRSFWGLARYYRRFVDEFESIASLLTTLTQKNVNFYWSEVVEETSKC